MSLINLEKLLMNPSLKILQKKTFTSRNFEDISCTDNGLTRFGMTQILNSFPESKLK